MDWIYIKPEQELRALDFCQWDARSAQTIYGQDKIANAFIETCGLPVVGGEGPIHVGPVKAMLSKFTFSMQGQWIEM